MPEENGISRRDFLKLIGYMSIVSLGGLGGLFELYKKRSSPFSSSIPPLQQTAFAQTTGGTWSLGQNTAVVAIHAALTYTGKIFYVSGSGFCINNEAGPYTARLLDLTTGAETSVTMSDDLFCGGAAQLPNGNILFVGGTLLYDTDVNNCNGKWHGANNAYEFDVPSGTLIKQTSMAHGRWYPTLVTLPNGNVVVVSGVDEYGTDNFLTEVYNSSAKSWTIQYDPTSNNTYCVGQYSTPTTCPGAGSPCYGGPNQGTAPYLDLYPRMNLMPSGLVFASGQIQDTHQWNPSIGAWTSVNASSQYRSYGTSILLPLQNTSTERGKVMIVGGSATFDGAATDVVEIEDFNQGTSTAPVLRTVASINNARKYVLPIILPNGKVIVFGGYAPVSPAAPVYIPEMFDPENESKGWTSLPAATVARVYHGVALLFVDGSVWTASSTPGECNNEYRTEIFKPDYFSATRPTISGTPSVGAYGQSINIPTPNPSSISRVSLVRLGATTHHFDTNVRLIWLQITGTGTNSVTVSAPLNANLAPPGYYMIHVLDSSLVPSTAKIIQIPGAGGATGSGYASLGGYILGNPAVARNSDGRLEVFVIGADHALYHTSQILAGSSTNWTGFSKLGGYIIGNPAVAQNADGRLEVFVIGADHALYHNFQLTAGSSNSWSGFFNLGGYIISNPVAGQNADGRLEVFVIGSDHALYHNFQTAPSSSNSWSGFPSLGGIILGDPAVARNSDGRLEVFVIGSDHALYHNFQTAASSSNSWSGFAGLGGYILGDPAVAQNADGRLEVFVIGSDHALYHNYQTSRSSSNSWSGYGNLGGTILSNTNPAVALNANNQLQVFVVGTDSAIYNKSQITSSSSNSWTGYIGLVGIVISNPVVTTNSDGRMELFVIGSDHALYANLQL